MPAFSKLLVGTLATLSVVHALPQNPSHLARRAEDQNNNPPPNPDEKNDELFAQLSTKSTAIKRFKLLLTENGKLLEGDALKERTVFDFNKAEAAPNAKGGKTRAATVDKFPILTDQGISTTVAFLNPCGINTPHVHPRATEFLTVVDGTVDFGMILENGLVNPGENAEIHGTLEKFQGTVFPMGSIHYQFNPTCKPATFVATLNKEDPGTSQVAQNFFGLNAGVVQATLGFPQALDGKNIDEFRSKIPANLAQAVDTCLKTCNQNPGQGQQYQPGQNQPGQNQPGQNQPGENQPGQNQPGQNQPGQNQPGQNQPGENQPGQNQPGQNQPGQNQPGQNQPGQNQPGQNQPGENQPGQNQPGQNQPGQNQPEGQQKPGQQYGDANNQNQPQPQPTGQGN